MPKSFETSELGARSGIQVEYTKSTRRIQLFGWYDTCVGIQPESYDLAEFFEKLGITLKDCERVLKPKS